VGASATAADAAHAADAADAADTAAAGAAAVTAGAGDGGEAAVTAAVTVGLDGPSRRLYERVVEGAPDLLAATYAPLDKAQDPMFVTPSALTW